MSLYCFVCCLVIFFFWGGLSFFLILYAGCEIVTPLISIIRTLRNSLSLPLFRGLNFNSRWTIEWSDLYPDFQSRDGVDLRALRKKSSFCFLKTLKSFKRRWIKEKPVSWMFLSIIVTNIWRFDLVFLWSVKITVSTRSPNSRTWTGNKSQTKRMRNRQNGAVNQHVRTESAESKFTFCVVVWKKFYCLRQGRQNNNGLAASTLNLLFRIPAYLMNWDSIMKVCQGSGKWWYQKHCHYNFVRNKGVNK